MVTRALAGERSGSDERMLELFFFFRAEDGILVRTVSGVQTCALPIFAGAGAFHGESAVDDPLVERLGLGELGLALWPDKDLAVEVAVPDVAEERDRHRGALDGLRCLDDALGQARDRNAHVGRNRARTGPQLQAGEIGLVARSP